MSPIFMQFTPQKFGSFTEQFAAFHRSLNILFFSLVILRESSILWHRYFGTSEIANWMLLSRSLFIRLLEHIFFCFIEQSKI